MHLIPSQLAVVTGAASGIGFALVRHLVDRGLDVVMVDLDRHRLEVALASVPAGAGRLVAEACDVTDPDAMTALAARLGDTLGPIHLLVNNAGILRLGTAHETALADWHAAMDVNLFGLVHGLRAFVPGMLAHGEPCHVLTTASFAALVGSGQAAPYLASKHGALAVSESLANDTAGTSLGVTVLCPGVVATDIASAELRRLRSDGPLEDSRLRAMARTRAAALSDPQEVAAIGLAAVERGDLYAFAIDAPRREQVRTRIAALERALDAAAAQELRAATPGAADRP